MKIRKLLGLRANEICDYFRDTNLDDHTIFHYINGPEIYINPVSEDLHRAIKKAGVAFIYTDHRDSKVRVSKIRKVRKARVSKIRLVGPFRQVDILFWEGKLSCVVDE